jgi:hypothetical protein
MDRARLPHAILKYEPAGRRGQGLLWRDFWMDEGGRNRPGCLTPWQHYDDDKKIPMFGTYLSSSAPCSFLAITALLQLYVILYFIKSRRLVINLFKFEVQHLSFDGSVLPPHSCFTL